ncbi:MAG: DUF4226 domain-containing protein [Mycobacterium sp.]
MGGPRWQPAAPPPEPVPDPADGAAADAIRAAETALAHQKSLTAQVDLQVVTALLSAHAAHADGAAALDALQNEIESAVVTRTDLDTPAGARAFQRYLIDKLRDIRTVVETADLDATSKASLAAALASLYASSPPSESSPQAETNGINKPAPPPEPTPPQAVPQPRNDAGTPFPTDTPIPVDLGLDPTPMVAEIGSAPTEVGSPASTAAPAAPAPVAPPPAAAMTAPAAGWGGGGFPGATMPSSGGLPTLPAVSLPDFSTPAGDELPHRDAESKADPDTPDTGDQKPGGAEAGPGEGSAADDLTIELPDGQSVTAPSPQLAAVISAAIAGTPIPDAFSGQGITIPAPGSPVIAPVDPAMLVPGDVGVFNDRHALALGDGKALLDNRIQPIDGFEGRGLIGWQHPPEPLTTTPPVQTTQG